MSLGAVGPGGMGRGARAKLGGLLADFTYPSEAWIEILASLPLRRARQPALGEGCVGAVGAGGMLVPASPWVGDHWGAGVVLAPAILLGGGQLACRVKGCAGDGDEESDSDDQGECDDDGDVWKR